MRGCKKCGSYAINEHLHGRDGSDSDLCDVCYWRKRADGLLEAFKLHICAFDGDSIGEIAEDYGKGTAARIHVARAAIAKAEGKE